MSISDRRSGGSIGKPSKSGHTTCFLNGTIRTQDPGQPLAEALVQQEGRICYVGSNREAKSFARAGARTIDLGGRLVLPGFIDGHAHLVWGGEQLQGIHLGGTLSREQFRQRIAEFVFDHKGEWITGSGWDHQQWSPPVLPTKQLIDEVSPDTPVLVRRLDSHIGLANSLALRRAGITAATPDPKGGTIVRDPATGEPTGVLKDAALELVAAAIPPPSPRAIEAALLGAQRHAFTLGVTSVHDITQRSDLEAYRRMEHAGLLRIRIHARLPLALINELIEEGVQPGSGSDLLKIGSLKAFSDGSLGAGTALFFDPYTDDPTATGLAMEMLSSGDLLRLGRVADLHGFQLSIHAIGDKANSLVLSLFEEIARSGPVRDRRFRIEHAQHVRQDDIPLFARGGVIVSAQPYHLVDDGVWAEKRIGRERMRTTYAFRSFLDAGVRVCFGSDWTVAPLDPLAGLYAAVTRRTADGKHPDGWIPGERIRVEDAVRCYTVNAAYAAFEEDTKGMLRRGMLADLVVLSEDIYPQEPDTLNNARVLMTVLDGQIVYEA